MKNISGLRRGGPGRPPGRRNKVPGTVKAALRNVFLEIHETEPELLETALRRGLKAPPPRSFSYAQLMAHYVLGKPPDKLEMAGELRVPVIINHFTE